MRFKLQGKLLLSFLSLVVLILILSIYSYLSMHGMGEGSHILLNHSKELGLAADAQIAAKTALMPVNDYLISGDPKERENFRNALRDLAGKVEEIKKLDLNKEETANLRKAEELLRDLDSDGNSILAKEAGTNAGMTGEMEKFDQTGEKLVAAFDDLHELFGDSMTGTMMEVDKSESAAVKLLIAISAVSIALGIFVGLLMSRRITRPILEIAGVAKKVADGDLTGQARVSTSDEIGDLGHAVNKMVEGLRDMVGTVNQSAAQVAAASDQVSATSLQIEKGAQVQASAADETSSSMEQMAASIQMVAKNAEDLASNVQETSASVNQMVASIEQVAKNSGAMASSVSQTSATIEEMAVSIDQVARDTENLSASVEETSATVEQMMASIEQVAKNSDILAGTVSETSTTIEEMTASIRQVAKNVSEADQLSKKAAEEAMAGGEAVDQTIEGIGRINLTMNTTAEVINSLGRRSEEIGKIVGVIEDIADQTNLLALNAAIEAARAGDAGRGFAVVADEVRKLAERSVVATKEISEVIKQVQQETGQAVKTAEAGAAETMAGKKLADKAGAALKKILESVGATSRLMSEINTATGEQALAAGRVLKAVDNMNQATDQVTTAVKEQAMGSNQIRKAVENMNRTTQQVAGAMKEQALGGKQIRMAVEDMNRVTTEVSLAAKEQASGSAQILRAVSNMNGMTQQVAGATDEQKRGGDLVVRAVDNIAGITRENLQAVKQMVSAAENITYQAESLQKAVSTFKVAEIHVNCWELMGCAQEFRFKCPAYQNPEKRCWLINGTWCKGVQQGDARSKLANCMHCKAFKVMQGVEYISAPAARKA